MTDPRNIKKQKTMDRDDDDDHSGKQILLQDGERLLTMKQEPIEISEDRRVFTLHWPEWEDALLPPTWVRGETSSTESGYSRQAEPTTTVGNVHSVFKKTIEGCKAAAGKQYKILKIYDGIYMFNSNPFPVKMDNGTVLPAAPKEIASLFRIHSMRLERGSNYGPVTCLHRERNYDQGMKLPISVVRAGMDNILLASDSDTQVEPSRVLKNYFSYAHRRMRCGEQPPHQLMISISMVAGEAKGFIAPRDTQLVGFIDTDDSHGKPSDEKKVCSNKFITF
jgi:hypothetical protein